MVAKQPSSAVKQEITPGYVKEATLPVPVPLHGEVHIPNMSWSGMTSSCWGRQWRKCHENGAKCSLKVSFPGCNALHSI
ncbi:hypothetical protein TrispH2_007085 [Trichoplax sp. H2]|nr:hypothetical protein TrispH2_007085 [Trichoplax sp. H2]|eukprot:RDD40545.1 hypothetical protein TrispH2_007085 [Trichoplax sp. H2]